MSRAVTAFQACLDAGLEAVGSTAPDTVYGPLGASRAAVQAAKASEAAVTCTRYDAVILNGAEKVSVRIDPIPAAHLGTSAANLLTGWKQQVEAGRPLSHWPARWPQLGTWAEITDLLDTPRGTPVGFALPEQLDQAVWASAVTGPFGTAPVPVDEAAATLAVLIVDRLPLDVHRHWHAGPPLTAYTGVDWLAAALETARAEARLAQRQNQIRLSSAHPSGRPDAPGEPGARRRHPTL